MLPCVCSFFPHDHQLVGVRQSNHALRPRLRRTPVIWVALVTGPVPWARVITVTARPRAATIAAARGERREARGCLDVSRRQPCQHANATVPNDPLLRGGIPIANVTAGQVKRDSLALAGLQEDLLKATQHLDRSEVLVCRLGKAKVQLGDGGASDRAGVLHAHAGGIEGVPECRVAAGCDCVVGRCCGDAAGARTSHRETPKGERGIRQAKAEFVLDGLVEVVKMTYGAISTTYELWVTRYYLR